MGYLIQYLELQDDVTVTTLGTIAKMQVRAKLGEKFLLIYSGLVKMGNTIIEGLLGITETNDGSSTSCQMSTNDTDDFHSLAGGKVITADADFEVRIDAGSGTARVDVIVRDAMVAAIKLADDDHFAQDTTPRSTTTQTPITDALELTFTPASQGDYLVIAMCKNISGQTTANCLIRLRANGVNDQVQQQRLHDTDDGQTWSHAQIYPALSGPQSFKIQFRTLTQGTNVTIDEQLIVALRVSDLDNTYDDEQQAAAGTTSSTFQTRAAVSFTPFPADHLIIGSAHTRRTSGTGPQEIQSVIAEDITEQIKTSTVTANATQQDHDYFSMVKRAMNDLVINTVSTKWRSPDGVTNVQIRRNNVSVLDLNVDGKIVLKGGKILGKTVLK